MEHGGLDCSSEVSELQTGATRCLRRVLHDLPPSLVGSPRLASCGPVPSRRKIQRPSCPWCAFDAASRCRETSWSRRDRHPPKRCLVSPNLTGGKEPLSQLHRSPLMGSRASPSRSHRSLPTGAEDPVDRHRWFCTISAASEPCLQACCIPLTILRFITFPAFSHLQSEDSSCARPSPRCFLPLEELPIMRAVTASLRPCCLHEVVPARCTRREPLHWWPSSSRPCSPTTGMLAALVARHPHSIILPGLFSPSRFRLSRCPTSSPEGAEEDTMLPSCAPCVATPCPTAPKS